MGEGCKSCSRWWERGVSHVQGDGRGASVMFNVIGEGRQSYSIYKRSSAINYLLLVSDIWIKTVPVLEEFKQRLNGWVEKVGTCHKVRGCSNGWPGLLVITMDVLIPANTRHRPNVRPMLGQHRRRWTNIGWMFRVCWEGVDFTAE